MNALGKLIRKKSDPKSWNIAGRLPENSRETLVAFYELKQLKK